MHQKPPRPESACSAPQRFPCVDVVCRHKGGHLPSCAVSAPCSYACSQGHVPGGRQRTKSGRPKSGATSGAPLGSHECLVLVGCRSWNVVAVRIPDASMRSAGKPHISMDICMVAQNARGDSCRGGRPHTSAARPQASWIGEAKVGRYDPEDGGYNPRAKTMARRGLGCGR